MGSVETPLYCMIRIILNFFRCWKLMQKYDIFCIMLLGAINHPYVWLVTCCNGKSYYVDTTKGHPDPIRPIVIKERGVLDFE